MGEGRINVPEAAPRHLDRLQHGTRAGPWPSFTIHRLLVSTPLSPSLAAQLVAVFFPISPSSSNLSASAGLSPNAKLSKSPMVANA
jgi:hypothetical protein